jgi:hypothetical protein
MSTPEDWIRARGDRLLTVTIVSDLSHVRRDVYVSNLEFLEAWNTGDDDSRTQLMLSYLMPFYGNAVWVSNNDFRGGAYLYARDQIWHIAPEDYLDDRADTFKMVLAAAIERQQEQQQKIERARNIIDSEQDISKGIYERKTIAQDVKMFVWQRDQGACTYCGDNRNLEFDHIIAVSMGGSNTARNLQLLCESCNRSKGAHL